MLINIIMVINTIACNILYLTCIYYLLWPLSFTHDFYTTYKLYYETYTIRHILYIIW